MITIYTSDLCVQVARLVTDVMTSSERCPEGPSSERLSRASVSPATATQAWNLPAKVEVEKVDQNHHQWPLSPGSMIDWSHMWWQVAKVVQKGQVAKNYHKHQSHQLQLRKLGNLSAKVDVETVDHNQRCMSQQLVETVNHNQRYMSQQLQFGLETCLLKLE